MQHLRHIRDLCTAILVAALLVLAMGGAQAQSLSDSSMDALFDMLHVAPDEPTAATIAEEIWSRWLHPDDPDLSMLLATTLMYRQEFRIEKSLEVANQIIQKYPDNAEGWNQRATINYMKGNYQASLDDINEVLKREPRHFGALSGKVLVYLEMGDKQLALKTMIEALAVHPFLSTRSLFPQLNKPAIRV